MEARDSKWCFGLLLLGGLDIVRFSFHRIGQGQVSDTTQLPVYRCFGDEFRGFWGELVDNLEGAAPAGEIDDGFDLAGLTAAGVRGRLLGQGAVVVGIMLLEGKVDEQRLADDGLARDEAPVAAVFAVVAVVSKNEVIAGGNDEFVVFDQRAHTDPPMGVYFGVSALEAGEVIAEVVRRAGAVDGVRLGKGVAVDINVAVVEAEMVARQADHAFDEVERRVNGVVKDYDVAALDGGGQEGERLRHLGAAACLLTRRKSPTRSVDSMDSEGMRKGCMQKVMMKIATTMR